ncbi:VOC family protein [Streptomyces violaceusniger]|uniref:Glyoxalase/bleomycin resistance protein/dioxygenase n=1 Tax=Streptomyces violaceusniger (strain Tu 4113) TaxID=653045 RepID=G2P506_STRV4|nr:VOC family protein [Streptomyces violaceusniger]AEM84183.1 Glyoxalase/bleomycin resistance protein/dioxygenase [Streptomyces violaceusniger Tu 4113]
MPLHRLNAITIGVPNVEATVAYYTDFGLTPEADGWLSSTDGGRQLRIVRSGVRRLVEVGIGAEHLDDAAAVVHRLRAADLPVEHEGTGLTTVEPVTGTRVSVRVAEPIRQQLVPPSVYNGPGRAERGTGRAPGVLRTNAVRPRKLGHVVLGSTDYEATIRFFTDLIGFKVSDRIAGHGAFLRCSTDHHNVLVLNAPVAFLHHSSWQVDDVDEVGRGASAMLEGRPDRHVWGLGRHHAGSNFFWYLKDPAGNFSEYYSDMDCILDDQLWSPETLEGARGLFNWGPPPPPSFLAPDDLAEMMTGAHQPG